MVAFWWISPVSAAVGSRVPTEGNNPKWEESEEVVGKLNKVRGWSVVQSTLLEIGAAGLSLPLQT
jgi:hypothetical protein